ncbi:MAG: KTSC domain-containing protein [Vicingaceae bacterium]
MKFPRNRNFKTKSSSMISEIHFLSTLKDEYLFVEFNTGAIYQYNDVPFSVYKTLKKANRKNKSVGSLFHDQVKNVGYGYKRLNN